MVLADWQIAEYCKKGMISPWSMEQVKSSGGKPIISYGLSSFGYDARLSREFKVFSSIGSVVDPKSFDKFNYVEKEGDECIIPPNSFALSRTVEWFHIPRDVVAVCLGKSTYARCGLIVNVTPLEPEWRGHVTLEISNTTPLPAKVYAWEGICQFMFLAGLEPRVSYADRAGKYMNQVDVTTPVV